MKFAFSIFQLVAGFCARIAIRNTNSFNGIELSCYACVSVFVAYACVHLTEMPSTSNKLQAVPKTKLVSFVSIKLSNGSAATFKYPYKVVDK